MVATNIRRLCCLRLQLSYLRLLRNKSKLRKERFLLENMSTIFYIRKVNMSEQVALVKRGTKFSVEGKELIVKSILKTEVLFESGETVSFADIEKALGLDKSTTSDKI